MNMSIIMIHLMNLIASMSFLESRSPYLETNRLRYCSVSKDLGAYCAMLLALLAVPTDATIASGCSYRMLKSPSSVDDC
jgi:hypothetical protein